MAKGTVRRLSSGSRLRPAEPDRVEVVARLYDAHVKEVYHFAYRRCRDHSLSEDVTQEAFLRAAKSTVDLESLTVAWLISVARNHLFDVLRRQTNFAEKLQLLRNSTAPQDVIDIAERVRVENALNKLSVDYRLVLTLHYVDGYSVPALADHLDRSTKSVESLVTRARRAFRAEFDDTAEGGRDE